MEDELNIIFSLADKRMRTCAVMLYAARNFCREHSTIKKPFQDWTAADIVEAVKASAPSSWFG
jgi:hypothetical protein